MKPRNSTIAHSARFTFTAAILALPFVLSSSGCELIANVDRSKIDGDLGGDSFGATGGESFGEAGEAGAGESPGMAGRTSMGGAKSTGGESQAGDSSDAGSPDNTGGTSGSGVGGSVAGGGSSAIGGSAGSAGTGIAGSSGHGGGGTTGAGGSAAGSGGKAGSGGSGVGGSVAGSGGAGIGGSSAGSGGSGLAGSSAGSGTSGAGGASAGSAGSGMGGSAAGSAGSGVSGGSASAGAGGQSGAAGKIIYLTATPSKANFGGVTAADALCNATPPVAGTYKALLVDGTTRVACTSALCATNGAAEGIGWVLTPNTKYVRANGTTVIGTTNSAGIFTFPLTSSIGIVGLSYWTGLTANWTTSVDTCSGWTQTTGFFANEGLADAVDSQFIFGVSDSCASLAGAFFACVQQ